MSENDKDKARVSKAPAPISPVRSAPLVKVGNGRAPVSGPKPADWDMWERIPVANLKAAIAVSLGYEPPETLEEEQLYSEGGEYRKRMHVALSHATAGKLHLFRSGAIKPGAQVELAVFAEWALSLGWMLPERFPGVAAAAFAAWKRKDLWSERELRDLCCGLIPDRSSPATDELNEAEEAIRRALIARALRAIEPMYSTAADRLAGRARFFSPQEAIPWAAARFPGRFPFEPEAMKVEDLAAAERPLAPKAKNTLLKIISALAKGLNLDLSQPSKSAVIIARLTEENGAPVGARAIEDYLKEARALTA